MVRASPGQLPVPAVWPFCLPPVLSCTHPVRIYDQFWSAASGVWWGNRGPAGERPDGRWYAAAAQL